MDWKEFLKPTKGKIISALVLTLILVPFVKTEMQIMCITEPCNPLVIHRPLLLGLLSISEIVGVSSGYLIAGSVISYLITCLFSWFRK